MPTSRRARPPDYQWDTAILEVSKNGKSLGTLEPTRRFYKIAQQGTAEVALRTRLNEDLYINYAARVGDKATLQAYVFPLVTWIWVGCVVLIGGTLVCLVPSKVARSYPRTEVVGIANEPHRREVPVARPNKELECTGSNVVFFFWSWRSPLWPSPNHRSRATR